ncbi:ryncolin-1 isoform X2 [Cherax quadricarinatus]|uniref:ryncolin-1 isoform X2 n=1 Tax=Cherax quadricarinatus TaxID=27406 RepID=UPI00387EE38D
MPGWAAWAAVMAAWAVWAVMGASIKPISKHRSNSSLLDVSRALQKLLPSDLPLTLLDVTPEEVLARAGEEGHNPLLSLALRHHALLQQRNEELLTQQGRCTAQLEALQEDKQELRLQLQQYKRQLQLLQKGRGDLVPPPEGTGTATEPPVGAKPPGKEGVQACPCRDDLTEEELEERNFVGQDCVCGNVTATPPTTPTTELLGTGARVKDCAGHQNEGATESGIYEIYPSECRAVRVWCDLTTDGGGWTVFLNRQQQDKQINFTRTWKEYKMGFGDVGAEYWLGNEFVHQLTAKGDQVLRVDAEDFNGSKRWGVWGRFRVEDEAHNYKLLAVMYSSNSTLGDGLLWHSGMQFSTIDKDNDKHKGSCAHEYKGGWWYNVCHNANPTGILTNSDDFDSVGWVYWSPREYKWASLCWLQMKIRPPNFGTPDPSDGPGDCSSD